MIFHLRTPDHCKLTAENFSISNSVGHNPRKWGIIPGFILWTPQTKQASWV